MSVFTQIIQIEEAVEKQLSIDRPKDNIGFILKKLIVEIDYQPIECDVVFVNPQYSDRLSDGSGKLWSS